MRKIILAMILVLLTMNAGSQSLAGEYNCHFRLNQTGNFIYQESGEKYFTMSIGEKGEVSVKMNIEMREEKTRATNYVDMEGSAEGEMTEGAGSFEANGILVISIYEDGKMDTRWEVSTQFNGHVVNENGSLKMTGTVQMTRDKETTSGAFTGEGKGIRIPYDLSYKFGYDYAPEEKAAFPLAIKVNYKDDNYTVTRAGLLKVYVPGTDMEYDYVSKGKGDQSYSYQTPDPNDRGAVFGPAYNVNVAEGSNLLELEFSTINANFLQMLPPNAQLCYITKVDVFSKKDNKAQQVVDTFRIKVRNHFKVHPLLDGKYEKAMVGNVLLDAGSGAMFFPLKSGFKIPVGARIMVQFIDGTIAVLEYPLNKSYPDLNLVIGLGISANAGINGEGDVIQFKLGQLSEKGEAKAETQVEKMAVKFLISTAQRGNAVAQMIDFFAASKMGGEKPVVMLRLRSVVGVLLSTDGSFVLKNYEGHPDVVTESGTNAVPAGQEFDLSSGKLRAIIADADLDELRNVLNNTSAPASGSGKGLLDKLTGKYWYITAGGGLLLVIIFVLVIRRGRKKKRN